MNRLTTLLLLSLFTSHFIGLFTGTNMIESGLFSADKLIKMSILATVTLCLIFRRRGPGYDNSVSKYILCGGFILGFLVIHQIFTYTNDVANLHLAEKEIVRFGYILAIFYLCSIAFTHGHSLNLFLRVFTIAGIVLSCLAIHHSFTGEAQMQGKVVAGFLRAGSDITDANILGAVLNIFSMVALASVLTEPKPLLRVISGLGFLLIQLARFSTFSTGSTLSFAISLAVTVVMLRQHRKKAFRSTMAIIIFAVSGIAGLLVQTGLMETVSYRLMFRSEKVIDASIGTRVDQYMGYYALVADEPVLLISGTSSAELPAKIGTRHTLHNCFLRALATGGVVGFVCRKA